MDTFCLTFESMATSEWKKICKQLEFKVLHFTELTVLMCCLGSCQYNTLSIIACFWSLFVCQCLHFFWSLLILFSITVFCEILSCLLLASMCSVMYVCRHSHVWFFVYASLTAHEFNGWAELSNYKASLRRWRKVLHYYSFHLIYTGLLCDINIDRSWLTTWVLEICPAWSLLVTGRLIKVIYTLAVNI